MKRILIFLIALTFAGTSKAQTITYDMLDYVLSHDFKTSSDYLVKNGFNIQKLYTPAGNTPDHYYDFVKDKGVNSITIKKESYGVAVFSYSNKDFIFLENYIKDKLGFKLDSTSNTIRFNSDFYQKGNLKMDFIEGWSTGFESRALIRSYYIHLINVDLEKMRDPNKIEW